MAMVDVFSSLEHAMMQEQLGLDLDAERQYVQDFQRRYEKFGELEDPDTKVDAHKKMLDQRLKETYGAEKTKAIREVLGDDFQKNARRPGLGDDLEKEYLKSVMKAREARAEESGPERVTTMI